MMCIYIYFKVVLSGEDFMHSIYTYNAEIPILICIRVDTRAQMIYAGSTNLLKCICTWKKILHTLIKVNIHIYCIRNESVKITKRNIIFEFKLILFLSYLRRYLLCIILLSIKCGLRWITFKFFCSFAYLFIKNN